MKRFLLVVLSCFVSGAFVISARAETLSFAFVGDILLAGQAGRIMVSQNNINYPFAKAPQLKKADITFGNLECVLYGTVVRRNVRSGKNLGFMFTTPPKLGKSLVSAGFDIVSLANNHALDGGKTGLLSTIKTLDELGVIHAGAGKNRKEAYELKVIGSKGMKIGFLAFADLCNFSHCEATDGGAGIAMIKNGLAEALDLIERSRQKVDLLIVSVHWGIERQTLPSVRQKMLAKKIIDAGADMIIGHHPHVLQPVEVYKGKIIAYSLGNFVFDNPKPVQRKTMILWVDYNAGKLTYKKIPCTIINAQPVCKEGN